MLTDCTVVIRSVGERTEALCARLVDTQVSSENVKIVKTKPFYRAVSDSFRIGMEMKNLWTFTIDADVLVRNGALGTMIQCAERHPGELFAYQGYVLDRLFNDYREGGPHLYRTELLPLALKYVSESSGSLRPESDVYHEMSKRGYGFWVDNRIYGIHDYFQFRKDIVRKCYMHAFKHRHLVVEFLTRQVNSLDDDDAKAALVGLLSGVLADEGAQADIDYLDLIAKRLMEQYALQEKGVMCLGDVDDKELVEEALGSFPDTSRYQRGRRLALPTKHFPPISGTGRVPWHYVRRYLLRPLQRRLAKVLTTAGDHLGRL